VTPQEKLSIEVAMSHSWRLKRRFREASIAFRLNTDDLVIAGPVNPIEVRDFEGMPVPYLHVRAGLWARCSRPVYYELAEQALNSGPENRAYGAKGLSLRWILPDELEDAVCRCACTPRAQSH
jgi:hypothetical protein